jgi:hypothetical protein
MILTSQPHTVRPTTQLLPRLSRALLASTLASIAFSVAQVAAALPFSAETTSRESKRVTAVGPAPYYEQSYAALTRDSRDLVFQEFRYSDSDSSIVTEPRFLAFSSSDGSLDDFYNLPRQCSSNQFHIYWLDLFSGVPVCLSYDREGLIQGEADGDSFNPKLGGPTSDEGRYVVFETQLDPSFVGNARPNLWGGKNPSSLLKHIVIHDRKWEETWLSTSLCDLAKLGADANQDLWSISDDGRKVLFTSAATNLADNTDPKCADIVLPAVSDLFIRDGAACNGGGRGGCITSVLFDTYELHTDDNLINTLDADARNAAMNADQKVVVFDTLATVPIKFEPDSLGFYDVYYFKDSKFTRVSGSARVPRCSASGELLPLAATEDPANNHSTRPRVDGPGRYVVFESSATDLVIDEKDPALICKETINGREQRYFPHPKGFSFINTRGNKQVYIYDNITRKIELVSHSFGSNRGASGDSGNAWISRDAHYIVFESTARDLLATTTTAVKNIFMFDRIQKKMYLVTPGTGGSGLSQDATITHVGTSGLVVAFQSLATDTVPANASNGGGTNGTVQHVYLAQNGCPIDTDGDAIPDCLDLCPSDANKSEPAVCGCGSSEKDSDNDGTPDCADTCSKDPKKSSAGVCGCGVAETDSDSDGVPDCVDACADDPSKTVKGACGCGVAETDTDADGTPDCADGCPTNPAKSVAGSCGCTAVKDEPGVCGCNALDSDDNGNGSADCIDPNVNTQPAQPVVDITEVRRGDSPAYQLLVKLQQFGNNVTYLTTLTSRKTGKVRRKTGSLNVVGFSRIPADTYTLKYSVKLGAVVSKETTVTVKVPGGIRRQSAAAGGTRR